MTKLNLIKLVPLFAFLFFLFAMPVYTAEECDPSAPPDPDNTYCQSGAFSILGRPFNVYVKCQDDNWKCCTFQYEKYIGLLGCCTNSNCMDCLAFMNQGEHGNLWSVLTSSSDVSFCGDGVLPSIWPELVYVYNNQYCNGDLPSPYKIDRPPSFCGNCDEGDGGKQVCIEFTALLNPCLDPDCGGLCCAPFDCLISDCWDVCGSNLEVLIRCDNWKTCGEDPCIAL